MRCLCRERDAFLDLPQRRLLLQEIGDIDTGADIAAKIPARRMTRDSLSGDPTILSIVPPQAKLVNERLARFEGALVNLHDFRQIIGMDYLMPAVAKVRLDRPSRKLDPRFVQIGDTLIVSAHPHQDRGSIRRRLETFLALP